MADVQGVRDVGRYAAQENGPIAAMLQQYLPRGRVVVTSLAEPPLSMPEWEDRLEILERRGMEVTVLRRIFWSVGAVF
jgi:hypothetical protein